jgi:amino-acid N-acetyltransferase
MTVRPAKVADAAAICELVNYYAERGRMLHRSLESVYNNLRDFLVAAQDDGRVVGCTALSLVWGDLAEVKSMAVRPELRRGGIGSALLTAALAEARRLGVARVFALTYETEFFARGGFEVIDRDSLPEKVWSECLSCPKADACDETAMMLRVDPQHPAPGPSDAVGAGGASER